MKKSATNSAGMKRYNRRLILNIIRKSPVSRAELARMTGLTRAAVTLIVDALLQEGVLIETGTAQADYGRKPVLLDLNSESCYAIGVSIARDGCSIGILNIKGVVLSKREVDLGRCHDARQSTAQIISEARKLITDSSLPQQRFLGIGISTPGPVDITTGTILNPPNFDLWHNVSIVQEFQKHFSFCVCLENNAASLALAEKSYGGGAEYQSFMLLVVDTGIGAGLIINENLYRGVGGFGSEVGHTSIDIHGKACSCGNKGCLEGYASILALIDGVNTVDPTIRTWNDVVDRALQGDEACRKAVENEAFYLSAGIINAMNILELDAVILAGDIQYKPALLLGLIRSHVETRAINRHIRTIPVTTASIGKDAEVLSSAAILFEKYFSGEVEV